MNSLWQRFQKYFLRYNDIGFTIDISRMRFADDFLQSMGARAQKAFSEMRQLEAGAIANVDERRMVGHYWLRDPGLAPSASLRNDIEETNARIKKFAADIHAGGIAPATGKFRHLLVIGIGGSALGRASDGRTARVSVCVHCRNYDGQWGRRGRQALVYAFWGVNPTSTRWVRETYRKRFAIETSYRQMQQGRARTSTRNPVVRLLLVGVALVLRDVWVWLHYACLSTPRRGGRRLNLERLPLKNQTLPNSIWTSPVARLDSSSKQSKRLRASRSMPLFPTKMRTCACRR